MTQMSLDRAPMPAPAADRGYVIPQAERSSWDNMLARAGALAVVNTARMLEGSVWEELDQAHPELRTPPPRPLNPGLWVRSQRRSRPAEPGSLQESEQLPDEILTRVVDGIDDLSLRGEADRYVPRPMATDDDLAAIPERERILPRRTAGAANAAEMRERAADPDIRERMRRETERRAALPA